MKINLVFDASVARAPAGFEAAAQAAANFFDSLISNPLAITIDVGWNEVNGQSIGTSALAESETSGYFYSYAQVRSALVWTATSPADHAATGTLPAADPTGGGQFFVASAEAQALGLAGSSGGSPDGWVGVSSAFPWAFDPNNRAVAGQFDAVGALEHEMSEVLGRIGDLGLDTFQGASEYDPLDLFRWSSPGVRDLTPGPGWFSVDGKTMLQLFNDPTQGGDVADWDPSVYGDSFGDGSPGIAGLVTPVDQTVMDALGYDIAGQNASFTGVERQYAVSAAAGVANVSGGPEGAAHTLVGATTIAFADGVLSFDPNSWAAQVYRLWDAARGKATKPGAAQAEILALEAGTGTLAAIAAHIAVAPSFVRAIAGMNDTQIVAYMFETALRRAPSASESAQWTGLLAAGLTLPQMILDFAASPEHVAITAPTVAAGLWSVDPAYALTEYMFQAALGRAPSSAELATWVAQVRGGLALPAMAADFTAMPQFAAAIAGKTNQQIVDYFYVTALHRAADPGGEAFWTAYLNGGHSVADLLVQIEQSPEFAKKNGAEIAPGVLVSGVGAAPARLGAFVHAMAATGAAGAGAGRAPDRFTARPSPMMALPHVEIA